jgi:hypothetical protein
MKNISVMFSKVAAIAKVSDEDEEEIIGFMEAKVIAIGDLVPTNLKVGQSIIFDPDDALFPEIEDLPGLYIIEAEDIILVR